MNIPGIDPSHTCKCETSDRNVFGGRIELDGRGDRRCGDPRDREYCDRDGGLEPKTIKFAGNNPRYKLLPVIFAIRSSRRICFFLVFVHFNNSRSLQVYPHL